MMLMEQLRSIKKELGLEKDDKSALVQRWESVLLIIPKSGTGAVWNNVYESEHLTRALTLTHPTCCSGSRRGGTPWFSPHPCHPCHPYYPCHPCHHACCSGSRRGGTPRRRWRRWRSATSWPMSWSRCLGWSRWVVQLSPGATQPASAWQVGVWLGGGQQAPQLKLVLVFVCVQGVAQGEFLAWVHMEVEQRPATPPVKPTPPLSTSLPFPPLPPPCTSGKP